MKMLLAAVLIDAGHPALEDREEAFVGVHVRLGAIWELSRPFLFGVVDSIMARETSADCRIRTALIGHQRAFGIGIVEHDGSESLRGQVLDFNRASWSPALNERDELHHVGPGPHALPAELGMQDPFRPFTFEPVIGLVNLDSLASPPSGAPSSVIASRIRCATNQADL